MVPYDVGDHFLAKCSALPLREPTNVKRALWNPNLALSLQTPIIKRKVLT